MTQTAAAPNILFIMSDEHRPDVLGYAGNPVVRTPNLDRLADGAVVFENAYTPSPICVPARQAIAAGQFPRNCGCERFGQDLAPNYMTWPRRLAQHGYATVCCGKMHHMGPDQMQGWTARPFGDQALAGWAIEDQEDEAFARNFRRAIAGKWSNDKEVLKAGIGDGPYQRFDAMATMAAEEVINRHFIDPYYDRPIVEQPLALKLSLLQPHYPYFTDADKFNWYLNRVPVYLDEPVFDHPFLSQRQVPCEGMVAERDLRRATAAYYGMIEQVDDHVGAMLDAIEEAGQDIDDWIVIYTSDHGEMLGEHGIWEKQKFFEASVRVPLFIRWPKHFGARRVQENVNLCDLFATLCELTGSALPDTPLDSRSLVSLMRGETDTWDDESISQFVAQNLMIKRGSLKYQSYGEQMPEVLFDLARDPTERSNFIDDPQYAEALVGFRARRQELGF